MVMPSFDHSGIGGGDIDLTEPPEKRVIAA
jgi:hypothetical protein